MKHDDMYSAKVNCLHSLNLEIPLFLTQSFSSLQWLSLSIALNKRELY